MPSAFSVRAAHRAFCRVGNARCTSRSVSPLVKPHMEARFTARQYLGIALNLDTASEMNILIRPSEKVSGTST